MGKTPRLTIFNGRLGYFLVSLTIYLSLVFTIMFPGDHRRLQKITVPIQSPIKYIVTVFHFFYGLNKVVAFLMISLISVGIVYLIFM